MTSDQRPTVVSSTKNAEQNSNRGGASSLSPADFDNTTRSRIIMSGIGCSTRNFPDLGSSSSVKLLELNEDVNFEEAVDDQRAGEASDVPESSDEVSRATHDDRNKRRSATMESRNSSGNGVIDGVVKRSLLF